MVNSLLILLAFQLLGEVIARSLLLPVPGPVIGMLLLFGVLLVKGSLVTRIERAAATMLDYLTLLYVPAAVGIVVHLDLLRSEGLPLIFIVVAGTIITIIVTALTMSLLLKVSRLVQESGG